MRLRLRPADTSFYDLFTRSAQHLVLGAELLDLALDAETTAWELDSAGEWHLHSGERHLHDELIQRQRRRRR